MGYTNYWYNKRAFTDDEWKRVKDEYKWLKEMAEGIIIDQTKLTSEIVFNGKYKMPFIKNGIKNTIKLQAR
jgi:hypothetical protein